MPFDPEIAKAEYIADRQEEWRSEWRHQWKLDHPSSAVPNPPEPPADLIPKAWAASSWRTGGVVIDMEAVSKLPATQQRKIFDQINKFNKGV